MLATGRGAGFRPQRDGVAAALDVLGDAVRRALGPGAAPPFADHVAAYVAGADFPEEEEALREAILSRGYGGRAAVGNDAFALLRAGARGPSGVAVVCGAGVNAVGASPDGRVSRFPALGRLSGDWGGGVLTARDPVLDGMVRRLLAERAPGAVPVVASVPPVAGAALLGLDALGAGGRAEARLREHFRAPA
ncbi:hypothetical protein ACFOWE_28135 [Planomonospora corallina]|uniref:ATPase n=1 Tax=Planomonospora corallina TaxID=1806052 RepID=A0ABV8IFB4_9ACTN